MQEYYPQPAARAMRAPNKAAKIKGKNKTARGKAKSKKDNKKKKTNNAKKNAHAHANNNKRSAPQCQDDGGHQSSAALRHKV